LVSTLILLAACDDRTKSQSGLVAPADSTFSIVADPTSVSVPQHSSVSVLVQIQRAPECASDVTLSLQDPPPGLFGASITVPAGLDQAVFRLVTRGDLPTGDLNATIRGASCDQTTVTDVALTVTDAACSSQKLIQDALDAGTIDYPTSLLYRAYALFTPSALPTCYQGDLGDDDEEDNAFFAEASSPDLDAATRAALAPFLARPNDATSIFQTTTPPGAPPRPGATSSALTATCVLNDGQIQSLGWKSARLDEPRALRVWVQCTSNPAEDEALLSQGLSEGSALWDLESSLMGPPLHDTIDGTNNPDTAIDVYIAPDAGASPRNVQQAIGVDALGFAAQTPSLSGGAGTSSAYILINRSVGLGDDFRSVLAHELFHAIEYSYNSSIAFEIPAAGQPAAEYWWLEAAAKWAESHFARGIAPMEVYPFFSGVFQSDEFPLHQPFTRGSGRSDGYKSFIWGFFAEENNGPDIIQSSWEALRGATSQAQATDRLDGIFDFKTNFRLFALRNLNTDLPGLLPMEKRYAQSDGMVPCMGCGVAVFPDDLPPDLAGQKTLARPDFFDDTFFIPPLKAVYYRFPVLAQGIHSITFRFDNINQPADVDVDAAVEIGDKWDYRSYTGQGSVRFCLDEPDQDLQDIYFIFSNHSLPLNGLADGDLQVLASTDNCQSHFVDWTGTFNIDASGSNPSTTTNTDAFGTTTIVTTETAEYHAAVPVESNFPVPLGVDFEQVLTAMAGKSVTATYSLSQTTTTIGTTATGCDFKTVSVFTRNLTGQDTDPSTGGGEITTPFPGGYHLDLGASVTMTGTNENTSTTTVFTPSCVGPPPSDMVEDVSLPINFSISTDGMYDVTNPIVFGATTKTGEINDLISNPTVTRSWNLRPKQ
jgi:hypothetical protein